MRRVLICDRFDAQVCELSENDVFELTRHEVVNGAHELTITTTQVLEKGYRVLMEDDRGYWHEWCVSGIDEQHANGSRPYGSYYCVWSLQPDLMGTRVSAMPGVQTPVTAAQALDAALGGTSRWTRGTITNTNTGGASMYDTDGWSAMSTLVANWGGEVDTTIGVSTLSGVVSRQVDLYAQQGESTAKRRFDFGADLVSVRRTIADEPLYCRITPRGKGEATEGGGYGRKITIESVNDGKDYLENASMVDLAKLPDGNDGWEYPTLEVENSECETPSDLLTWSQGVLEAYTTPKVTYEVNVVQAAKEGIDLQGVSLGDAVQIVDGKFNDLRLTGRVMEITIDELAHTTTSLTIGSVTEGISSRFSDLYSGIKTAEESVSQLAQSLSTADYIESLLDRINTEINATGGYTYIVPGNGILTFDVAVADPLNPVEASQVVEIKGGSIRIANTKTAQGQWEWKTVFTSGHIAADLVTAAQLTTGYIGNASGTYWDLDNNLLHLPATTIMDDTTLGDIANQEIGGTNLLDDTNAPSLTKVAAAYNRYIESTSAAGYTSTIEEIADPPVTGIKYGQHLIKTSGVYMHSVSYYTGGDNAYISAVKAGQTYTMSVYARNVTAASDKVIKFQYAYKATGATSASYIGKSFTMENDTAWHRYSWTFTTPTNMQSIGIIAYCGGISSEMCNTWFCGWKLEAGEKATDWSISTTDAVYPNTMIRAYGSGVLVCKQGNTVGALVNSNGSFDVVAVTWSGTTPTAGTVYASYGNTCQIGQSTAKHVEVNSSGIMLGQSGSGTINVNIDSNGVDIVNNNYSRIYLGRTGSNYDLRVGRTDFGQRVEVKTVGSVDILNSSNTNKLHLGTEQTTSGGVTSTKDYYSLGERLNKTSIGSMSFTVGTNTASALYSTAFGFNTVAGGQCACTFGDHTQASSADQLACGRYNSNNSSDLFEVGNGTSSSRANAFRVTTSNTAYVGSTQVTSDRRVKTPLGEITDAEATEFVRQLKPSKFEKFGRKELGFYAQDVEKTNLGAYLVDESNDHGYEDFKNLSYDGLIAPLVAYAQSLEKRIEELERRLDDAE